MHRLSALFMRHTTSFILLVNVNSETSTTCQSAGVARRVEVDVIAKPSPILRLHSTSRLGEGTIDADKEEDVTVEGTE